MSVTREHLHAVLFSHFVSNTNNTLPVCFGLATEAVDFYVSKLDSNEQQLSVKDAAKNAEDETKVAAHIEHHMVSRSNFIKLFAGHPDGHPNEDYFPRQRMFAEELLTAERVEQICVHGRSVEQDFESLKLDRECFQNAAYYCTSRDDFYWPKMWDASAKKKILEKPFPERLIIAASFLCAEAQVRMTFPEHFEPRVEGHLEETLRKYYDVESGNMKFDIGEWQNKINKV